MSLNDEDIKIIQRTWEIPRKAPAEAGVTILTKYFEKFPDHMKKFEKFRDIPLDELKTTDKFRNHAAKIIDTFEQSVTALSTNNVEEKLNDIWTEMADVHFRKKIPKPYFEDLKGVIFEVLGPLCSLSERDAEAWTKFFQLAYDIVYNKIDQLEAAA